MICVNGIWRWRHHATSGKLNGYENIISSYNIISVKDYKELDEASQRRLAKEVLGKIRETNIYPTYYYSPQEIHKDIDKCFKVPTNGLISYHTAGNTMLEYLFPNMHRVDAGNSTSNCLYNRFYDDDKLMKCIIRHMKNYPFTNLRTMFFMYGRYFWQTATGFSPMRAKAIYTEFVNNGDVVYDMSAGFGGRMLGAVTSNKNLTYIGCEPDTNTFHNLSVLGEHLEEASPKRPSISLINSGSEDTVLARESVDFIFSCPPYYGLERYSQEETQSIVKYPAYEDWLNNYVYGTLYNAYNALKSGGRMALVLSSAIYYLNINYELGSDWKRLAEYVGFKFLGTEQINKRVRGSAELLYVFEK